jgi:D-allulose-6-phosphate 3-epimerase
MIKDMKLKTKISVDGNVNTDTIPQMIAAGGDILVLGSSGLFRKDLSILEAISQIKLAIDKGIELKEKQ